MNISNNKYENTSIYNKAICKLILQFFKTKCIILIALMSITSYAQQGVNYQGVARNAEGDVLIDTEIALTININKVTENGETVYSEGHNPTTDANGVFSLVIGQGAPSLNLFEDINWAENQHFMNVWLDGEDIGTTELMSVPYAQAIGKWQAHKNGLTIKGTGGSIYVGDNAGENDDFTNNNNIGLGENSLQTNSVGVSNVAIGKNSLTQNRTGSSNIAIGSSSLNENVTGIANIAIGSNSLKYNVGGQLNIALGQSALRDVTGFQNVGVGSYTLYNNNSGNNNSAFGESALGFNFSGSNNTSLGAFSGQNAVGSGNVYLGYEAGNDATGDNKLYIENSSTNAPLIYGEFDNNIIGFNAKVGIGTNNSGVSLHVAEGDDVTLGFDTGYIILGDQLQGNLALDSNEIQAREGGLATDLELQALGGNLIVGGAIVHASDRRLKRDIENISYGLNEILELHPTEYFWKGKEQEHKSLGLIAQEVDEVIKNVVTYNPDRDRFGVSYTELIPVLIKAIQEQQLIIETQQKRNNRQSQELSEISSRIEIIESKLLQHN